MKGLQHANKVQTAYRASRKGLNNLGREKDRATARTWVQKKKRSRFSFCESPPDFFNLQSLHILVAGRMQLRGPYRFPFISSSS